MKPDLLVVGAGPCGVSAALWARSLGLDVLVLEGATSPGGQLLHVYAPPLNFAGAADGDGPALAGRLGRQIEAAAVPVRYGDPARLLEAGAPVVHTVAGERFEAGAILIASGVRRRPLDVPGVPELEGAGVSYSATQDRAGFAGEDVAVIGGGDAAFENALLLAEVGCRITMVVRSRARARGDFLARVAADPRIELIEDTRVTAIEGEDHVQAVRLEGARGAFSLPVAGLVIKVGVLPNSEWCRGAVECDPDGYPFVDERLATSHPRAWAAGDVTRPPLFGLAAAVGQGALAVEAIRSALKG